MGEDTVERAIFISYRRDDSEGEAGRLFDDLVAAFGDQSVFMDVSGIQPGLDFRKAIDDNVKGCGVLLAVLGPQWTGITDASGARRLENPNDFVRLEIASALAREIPVIPVLVHAAKMPNAADLPDNLKDLSYRNSVEITHARWNSDVALLVEALRSYVSFSKKHETETVHATVPVQLPAPQAAAKNVEAKTRSWMWPAIGAAVVLLTAVGIFLAMQSGKESMPQVTATVAASAPTNTASGGVAVMTDSSQYAGNWQNQLGQSDAARQHVARLELSASGKGLLVHAWGYYVNGERDWGTQTATWQNGQFVAQGFEPRFAKKEQEQSRNTTLHFAGQNGVLHVSEINNWQPRSGIWQPRSGIPTQATLSYTFAKEQ